VEARRAKAHGLDTDWVTINLDAALADSANPIYFDAQTMGWTAGAVKKAVAAGKRTYSEKLRRLSPLSRLATCTRPLTPPTSKKGNVKDKLCSLVSSRRSTTRALYRDSLRQGRIRILAVSPAPPPLPLNDPRGAIARRMTEVSSSTCSVTGARW
jgi:hypothetical protein